MRRWIAVGVEPSFGSSVTTPAFWLDCMSASLDSPSNPFIEIPSVRTRSIHGLKRGLYIPTGDIELVLDKHKMGPFLRSLLGNYLCQGFTKDEGASTLDGEVDAGDTEITVSDATDFSKDDLVQVGDDWAYGTEVHKIAGITNEVLTLEEKLVSNHPDGANVQKVSAPFTHFFSPLAFGDLLPSLELRVVKDGIGGDHRFLGSTVNTAEFSLDVNDVMKATFSIIAQKDEVVGHYFPVSSQSFDVSGFGFDEVGYVRFEEDGATAVDLTSLVRSMSISYSNGIQAEIGGRFGSRFPVELPTGAVEATARVTLVFRDLQAYEWLWGQGSRPGETVEPKRGNFEVKMERRASPNESFFFNVYRAYARSVAARLVGPETIVEEVEFMGTAGDSGEPFTITHWNSTSHLYGDN